MKAIGLILVLAASAFAVKNYSGYQVLRVVPRNLEELEKAHKLYNVIENAVDFWKEPRSVGHPIDMMIAPNLLDDIKVELAARGLDFTIFQADVQQSIDAVKCKDCDKPSAGFDYTVYHTIDEISQWVTDFANEQPLAEEINIGKSYEGRNIKALKISSGGSNKRIIYFQCGIHAREWISPATCMYMVNQLATTYDSDSQVKAMVDNYDWIVIPSLNVDGYAYTWSNDRMWRKNRQPNNSPCAGTDLNRNYPYQWGGTGSSGSPCSDTYRGTAALSGTETMVVHNWIQQYTGRIALFIDFHNYGQLWLYPWGYTGDKNKPQPDKDDQKALADKATTELQKVFGTSYFVGMSGPDMYPASGASEDYGYGTLGVKYTYVVELRDEGRYGFNIPERMIEDSGIETFEALKVFGNDDLM